MTLPNFNMLQGGRPLALHRAGNVLAMAAAGHVVTRLEKVMLHVSRKSRHFAQFFLSGKPERHEHFKL